jgi:hypothetical protein
VIECPADKLPWRDTKDGAMPLLVPAEQLAEWRRAHPKLWIEALPAGILLTGRALMPRDLINAAEPSD